MMMMMMMIMIIIIIIIIIIITGMCNKLLQIILLKYYKHQNKEAFFSLSSVRNSPHLKHANSRQQITGAITDVLTEMLI